jgi:hypothetical protein
MTDSVIEVLVDPDDDVATSVRLRQHFGGGGARVLAIPPFAIGSTELVWTILRALGKDTSTVAKLHDVGWPEATTWLRAHGIHTLVILCTQHLQRERHDELLSNTAAAGVSLILVYGQAGHEKATTTLTELLSRPLAPATGPADREPWPAVPKSHPLRFRYDCEQQLDLDEFLDVEELLRDVHELLSNYLLAGRTPREIARVAAILSYGEDCNQRHIRKCGVQLALMSSGNPLPKRPLLPAAPGDSPDGVAVALRHAHPHCAAFVLARALTGIEHRLLALVRGDQFQVGHILGVPIPQNALPILHALPNNVLLRPPHDYVYPPSAARNQADSHAQPAKQPELVEVLERLLRQRKQREPADELQPETVSELDNLVALGVIELDEGVYRVSRLGAYSSYLQNAGPPSAFKHHFQLVASHDQN